jgi:hypothetical protein
MDLSRLTPKKQDALYAMSRAPLTFEKDVGWSNDHGGPFNTHTIVWLGAQGLCTVYAEERALITRAGRQAHEQIIGAAA